MKIEHQGGHNPEQAEQANAERLMEDWRRGVAAQNNKEDAHLVWAMASYGMRCTALELMGNLLDPQEDTPRLGGEVRSHTRQITDVRQRAEHAAQEAEALAGVLSGDIGTAEFTVCPRPVSSITAFQHQIMQPTAQGASDALDNLHKLTFEEKKALLAGACSITSEHTRALETITAVQIVYDLSMARSLPGHIQQKLDEWSARFDDMQDPLLHPDTDGFVREVLDELPRITNDMGNVAPPRLRSIADSHQSIVSLHLRIANALRAGLGSEMKRSDVTPSDGTNKEAEYVRARFGRLQTWRESVATKNTQKDYLIGAMYQALATRRETYGELQAALAAAASNERYEIDLTISEKVVEAKNRLDYLGWLNTEIIALGSTMVRGEEVIMPRIFPQTSYALAESITQPASETPHPDAFEDFVLGLNVVDQLDLLRMATEIGLVHHGAITTLLSVVAIEGLRKFRHEYGYGIAEIDGPLQEWAEAAAIADEETLDQLIKEILEIASGLRQDIPGLEAFSSFRGAMEIHQTIQGYPDRLRRTYDEYYNDLWPQVDAGTAQLGKLPLARMALYVGAETITDEQWCKLFAEGRTDYEKQRETFGLLRRGIGNALQAKEVKMPAERLAALMDMKADDKEGRHKAAMFVLILRTLSQHLSDSKFRADPNKAVQIWQQKLARALEDEAVYAKICKKAKLVQASRRGNNTNWAIDAYENHTKLSDLIDQLRELVQDKRVRKMLTNKTPGKKKGQRGLEAVMTGIRFRQVQQVICEYDTLPQDLRLLTQEEELKIDWRTEVRAKALNIIYNAFRVETPEDEELDGAAESEAVDLSAAPPELGSAVAALANAVERAQSARGRRSMSTIETLANFNLDAERVNAIIAATQGYQRFGAKPTVVEGHLNTSVDELPYAEFPITLPNGQELVLAFHMARGYANLGYVGPPGSSALALRGDRRNANKRSGGTIIRTLPGQHEDMLEHLRLLARRLTRELGVPSDIAQILPDTFEANRKNGTALPAAPAKPWRTPKP